MRSPFAAIRTLVLPAGATSGARIILDGVNAVIDVYDAISRFVRISPADGVYIGRPGADALSLDVDGVGPTVRFVDSDPSATQDGHIRGTTTGASAPTLRLEPAVRNAGDRVQLDLVAENEAGTARPYIALGRSAPGGGYQLRAGNGTDQVCGTATLAAGTVTVNNANITANTLVLVARQAPGGALGHLSVARVAGTSFTINSSSATDTSTIAYLLVEPI